MDVQHGRGECLVAGIDSVLNESETEYQLRNCGEVRVKWRPSMGWCRFHIKGPGKKEAVCKRKQLFGAPARRRVVAP